jgi:hypothetical protein
MMFMAWVENLQAESSSLWMWQSGTSERLKALQNGLHAHGGRFAGKFALSVKKKKQPRMNTNIHEWRPGGG